MRSCNFPSELTAGDSLSFTFVDQNYPADEGWVVTYRLVPSDASATVIELVGVADGDAHVFSEDASTTATWAAGSYSAAVFAAEGGSRITVSRSKLEILPDPATLPAGTDTRSDNERALDAIIAVLEKRASLDQERYRINNRELYRTSIKDLISLRAYYENKVAAERAKACGRSRFNVAVKVVF